MKTNIDALEAAITAFGEYARKIHNQDIDGLNVNDVTGLDILSVACQFASNAYISVIAAARLAQTKTDHESPCIGRFKKAAHFSLPIIASGSAWWNIVDTDQSTFCSVVFAQADLKHPDYKGYMQEVEQRVDAVVGALNK